MAWCSTPDVPICPRKADGSIRGPPGREVALGFAGAMCGWIGSSLASGSGKPVTSAGPRAQADLCGRQTRFTRPVHVQVRGHVGEPLNLVIEDELGNRVEGRSSQSLVAAHSQPSPRNGYASNSGGWGAPRFTGAPGQSTRRARLAAMGEMNRLRRECVGQLESTSAPAAPMDTASSAFRSGFLHPTTPGPGAPSGSFPTPERATPDQPPELACSFAVSSNWRPFWRRR